MGSTIHYDFYINIDNVHLLTEKKASSKINSKSLDARYKYGMVIIGLAFLNDFNNPSSKGEIKNDGDETVDIYEKISDFTKIISPILLPLISGLSDLKEEELVASYSEDY